MTPDEGARAVEQFFDNHLVAGLIMPSGWFGRPHDNMHEMTACIASAGILRVELDSRQVLAFEGAEAGLFFQTVTIDGRRGLRLDGFTRVDWGWRQYGSGARRHRSFTEGAVTFVAPLVVVPSELPRPAHQV